ncbi:hypothetical protein ACFS5J_01760 [Flavobacterium chuncheonense]|uniref:Uncharacterized protein n=1 Tax=Flavobacterium chuncheonense TaxID=2026653 RepID=A0ABW5YI20_9FLAO
MDELELLKRDWKKNENSFNQISEKEIYAMLHKRSSSIVKWILIISILEIIFWVALGFIVDDQETSKTLELYHLKTTTLILSIINYTVIVCFIFLFYKNYKTINTTDSIKKLMNSILKTRKTVQYYVWYNLGMTFFSFLLIFFFQFKYDPNIKLLIDKISESINPNTFYFLAFAFYLLIALTMIVIIWLFYKLLYGILLKRLNQNYQELKKLDL